jgi:hypothetical protein
MPNGSTSNEMRNARREYDHSPSDLIGCGETWVICRRNGPARTKELVEAHGGMIDIESDHRRETHGTVVRVFLPLKTTYTSSPAPT